MYDYDFILEGHPTKLMLKRAYGCKNIVKHIHEQLQLWKPKLIGADLGFVEWEGSHIWSGFTKNSGILTPDNEAEPRSDMTGYISIYSFKCIFYIDREFVLHWS